MASSSWHGSKHISPFQIFSYNDNNRPVSYCETHDDSRDNTHYDNHTGTHYT